MAKKVLGIVGSYRKERVIDNAVTAVLEGAAQAGADTEKIYLIDKHIEFCDNCRACTQQEQVPSGMGKCVHHDDMEDILRQIKDADAIVLGSPINFFTVTAVTKRFVERLIIASYWPWGGKIPKMRTKELSKKAVIVTSSACPALLGRIMMPNSFSVLKAAATCVGAKVVSKLYFGLAAKTKDAGLDDKAFDKARQTGKKLV